MLSALEPPKNLQILGRNLVSFSILECQIPVMIVKMNQKPQNNLINNFSLCERFLCLCLGNCTTVQMVITNGNTYKNSRVYRYLCKYLHKSETLKLISVVCERKCEMTLNGINKCFELNFVLFALSARVY